MKKQKINKKRIFVAFGLGVTLGSLFINPMNNANACVVDSSSYYYNKAGNDFKTIHNRLVDENIAGYNWDILSRFYYEYESNKVLFQDIEDFTGFVNNALCGDYIIISEYSSTLKDILSNIGVCFSAKKSDLMSYSTFSIPLKELSRCYQLNPAYWSINYASVDDYLICDVTGFKDITFDSSLSKDIVETLFDKCTIIEYIDQNHTCYDNKLTISNDGDIINEGISFAPTNSLMKQIDSTNYSLINDSKYTFWQIKNMFNAYDGAGNTTDIYRDYNAEEELRTNGNAIYNERDIQLGISYMCICGYDYKENKSSITIKINTIKNNITEVLANTKSIVYTNKININKTDILNCISKADGNVNEILAYSYTKSDPQQYVDEICRFNAHESWFFVYSNFNGDIKSVEVKYSEKYIEPVIDTSIDNSDDKGNNSGNSGGSNDTTKKDDSHWYDGILKVLINIINWLCGK